MPVQTHLFASHKYYIWAFEKALRDECGYTGYQPVGRTPSPTPTYLSPEQHTWLNAVNALLVHEL